MPKLKYHLLAALFFLVPVSIDLTDSVPFLFFVLDFLPDGVGEFSGDTTASGVGEFSGNTTSSTSSV